MDAKFKVSVTWYDLSFEAGKVYDLDEGLYSRLLRAGSIEPVYPEVVKPELPMEVDPEVEPEPEFVKPKRYKK